MAFFTISILLLMISQTAYCYTNYLSSHFVESGEIHHAMPDKSYLVMPLMYSAGRSKQEGYIHCYEVYTTAPWYGGTLRFQVWERGNTANSFVFRGENVISNIEYHEERGYMRLYPNDADQIEIRENYVISLYVDEYSLIPYTNQECQDDSLWILPTSDPDSPLSLGQSYSFSEYEPYWGPNQCMNLGVSVSYINMDFSCHMLELPSINYEGVFSPTVTHEEGPQSECWVIRMTRPCSSSAKGPHISPSVITLETNMQSCDDERIQIQDGAAKDDNVQRIVCDREAGSLDGNNYAMRVEYKRYGDYGTYDVPFVMKYYINFDYSYLSKDFEYCEGEYNPLDQANRKRIIIGIILGILVFLALIIITCVCVRKGCLKCKNQAGNQPTQSANQNASSPPCYGQVASGVMQPTSTEKPTPIPSQPYPQHINTVTQPYPKQNVVPYAPQPFSPPQPNPPHNAPQPDYPLVPPPSYDSIDATPLVT